MSEKKKGTLELPKMPANVGRLLPVLGAILLVFGAVLVWDGWRQDRAEAVEERVLTQRDRASAALLAQIGAQRERFGQRRADPGIASALEAGDEEEARRAFLAGAPANSVVEFHPVDFAPIFEGDLAEFGFGRLALLERSLNSGDSQVAMLREGGQPWLGLAGPVIAEGRVLAVALLRSPADTLIAELRERVPGGGYLGLKQGRFVVGEAGDSELAALSEARAQPLQGTPMRITAAAPVVTSGIMDRPMGYILGGLLLLAGVGAIVHGVRGLRGAGAGTASPVGDDQGDEVIFADALKQSRSQAGLEDGTADSDAPRRSKPAAAMRSGVALDRSIFRAYDVRGVVGKTLDRGVAVLLGHAIGTLMHEREQTDIVVGRDGRLSGPEMVDGLIEGLRAAGRNVTDIGEAATPVVYFAAFHLRTGSCVAVTGSHNPPDYNGFKIVVGGETLSGGSITDLYERIVAGRLHTSAEPGLRHEREVAADYIERIAGDIQIERRIKVVVDCGNGVPGAIAPDVLEAIGCEVVPLFCEVDGTFPNHHPDPSDPANLTDLINMVQRMDAELGLAFDGDGDRLGVVTRQGEIIYPDRLLMLFAQDVLVRNPGACVIYDVKCTGHLAGHILRHGGSPVMWKTGHSLIKAKMRETEAELAGEMSGHFFFRERWYGFDDGIYAAARLLEIIASDGREPEEIFAELPKGVSTPELKIEMEEGDHYAFIEKFRERAKFEGARIATIDGIRADWPDGWGLVRASNTTPVVVLRFDADSAEALSRIQAAFREQLLAIDPELILPF